jgi:thioredoxin 1
MNPTSRSAPIAPGWILVLGLLLGGGLLVFMSWESFFPAKRTPRNPDANIIELTEANWQKEVVESKVPVLVDFTAEWCVYCRKMDPTIEKLAAEYGSKIKVGKVDFDKNPRLRQKYEVEGIPHLFIFRGGEDPINSLVGLQTEAKLVAALDAALKK